MGSRLLKALVIGGTGPTGPFIVEGLRQRGFQVSVLNRGVHRIDLPSDVETIVGDPHFAETLRDAIGTRTFDVVIACYGRLTRIAEVFAGKTAHLIAAGGFAAYRGWHDRNANFPSGLPLPTPEESPLITDFEENAFAAKIAAAEAALFQYHPTATVFRYPYVYGPRQVSPREWCIVRRVLDGRRTMLLPNGGRTFITHGYSENLAHSLMLAVEQPEKSAGRAYNCGDLTQLDHQQIMEVAADEMGVELELLSIPVVPATPSLTPLRTTEHKLMDLFRLRTDLGYTDLVHPVEAMRRTFRWYIDNPLERDGEYEKRLFDPFDYAAEDKAIAAARAFTAQIAAIDVKTFEFVHPYAHPDKPGIGRDQRGR
jgi:nucleoside-diphosphate-sugar epimerase